MKQGESILLTFGLLASSFWVWYIAVNTHMNHANLVTLYIIISLFAFIGFGVYLYIILTEKHNYSGLLTSICIIVLLATGWLLSIVWIANFLQVTFR